MLEGESRYEGSELGKNIARLKKEKRKLSVDGTTGGVKVSKGRVMRGLISLRSLGFILRIV